MNATTVDTRTAILRAMRPALRAYHRAKKLGTVEAWATFEAVQAGCVEALASFVEEEKPAGISG